VVAGHFGFAAIVKSREKSTPLWALMLATVTSSSFRSSLLIGSRCSPFTLGTVV